MALLQWNEAFSVGVAAVDHEHRELIVLINALHESLVRDASDPEVEDFLGEIHARIAAHFALEEKEMREHHYDEFVSHKADHETLLDDIRDIMDDYELDRHLDEESLSRRLEAWFSEHFRTHDARLHQRLG